MQYIKVAVVEEFDTVSMKSCSLLGKKIGIFKRLDGSFYAIETTCKHQGADLTKGPIDNGIATCPRHGWQYDLETGECLNHDSPPLRKYSLVIEGNEIRISIHPVSESD